MDFRNAAWWAIVGLLVVFAIKQVAFVSLFPFFQHPDEQTHYATIQHWTYPPSGALLIPEENYVLDSQNIATYHFSEEVIRAAEILRFDTVKFQQENTQPFSLSQQGPQEDTLLQNSYDRSVRTSPPHASPHWSIYYLAGSGIEKFFTGRTVLERMFAVRFFSASLGLLVVLLVYLTCKKIGWTPWHSLLIATVIAFQPMFGVSAAQINIDIALIFSFSLFVYASVSLLRDGPRWPHTMLLTAALALAVLSKSPGITLLGVALPLLGYLAYNRFNLDGKKFLLGIILSGTAIIAALSLLVPREYLVTITRLNDHSRFESPVESLSKYISKTIDTDAFLRTEASYWGNFGWLDTGISETVTRIIFLIEVAALIGVIIYLLSGMRFLGRLKITGKSYLPEKKYVVLFIAMTLALQAGIRFYDWRIFDTNGQILIGTPGRYFLPNIIPHIFLIVTGLGFFTRDKKQFDILLKMLLLLMILLSFYSIINVIVPRYYL